MVVSDSFYRSALQFTKFFSKGWGSPQLYEKLFDLQARVAADNGVFLSKVYEPSRNVNVRITSRTKDGSLHILNGEFLSPFSKIFPGALPPESEIARFQMVLPTKWMYKKPIVIHYGGTGDHFFWRRRVFMALPLAKDSGIGSIILENPFYGERKPADQVRSGLNHVLDIFLMGGALLMETITLLSWCENQGLGPFGLTGVSMGGHMASVCATACKMPIALVPCLSWSTAGPVFTRGVMSNSVAWDVLEKQLDDVPCYGSILKTYCHSFLSTNPVSNMVMNDKQSVQEKVQNLQISESIERHNLAVSDYTQKEEKLDERVQQPIETDHLIYRESKEYGLGKQKFNVLTLDNNVTAGIEATYNTVLNFVQDKINFDLFRERFPFFEGNTKGSEMRAKYYMNALMDNATHLRHFRKPNSNNIIVYVIASHDQYVPRDNEMSPCQIWGNVSFRYIDAGHVMGILMYHQVFRDAIHDAISSLLKGEPRTIE